MWGSVPRRLLTTLTTYVMTEVHDMDRQSALPASQPADTSFSAPSWRSDRSLPDDTGSNSTHAGTTDWAIVLAPLQNGWRVKYVPHGSCLANGGAWEQSAAGAIEIVHQLVHLLTEDELTVQLFSSVSVTAASESGTRAKEW